MSIQALKEEIEQLEKIKAAKLDALEKLEAMEENEEYKDEKNKECAEKLIDLIAENRFYKHAVDDWFNKEDALERNVDTGVYVHGYRERKGTLSECNLDDEKLNMVSVIINVPAYTNVKDIVKDIK